MNHFAMRKRQLPLESNDTSLNPITDFEWKSLLARRQDCKERVTKIKDGIDSATDRITRLEINRSSKVNEKSCVASFAFSYFVLPELRLSTCSSTAATPRTFVFFLGLGSGNPYRATSAMTVN